MNPGRWLLLLRLMEDVVELWLTLRKSFWP